MQTKAKTPQEVINACTRLINSGKFKGDELAMYYYLRADRYFLALRDADRAIVDQSQAIKHWLGSSDPQVKRDLVHQYSRLSSFRLDKGDHEGAIADATQAIKHAPTHVLGYSMRAYPLLAKGDLNGALSDISDALTWSDEIVSLLVV